eukprot:768341-Hanusia_phi.AAC.5
MQAASSRRRLLVLGRPPHCRVGRPGGSSDPAHFQHARLRTLSVNWRGARGEQGEIKRSIYTTELGQLTRNELRAFRRGSLVPSRVQDLGILGEEPSSC